MGVENYGSNENVEPQKEESSISIESVATWLRDTNEYAKALIHGDTEAIAEHHITHSDEFDDEEAVDVLNTNNLDTIARYLEGDRTGSISEPTLLAINDRVRAQVGPHSNVSAEEFRQATRIFRILNRNQAVATSNTDAYLRLIARSQDTESKIQFGLSSAPAYLAGIEHTALVNEGTPTERDLQAEVYSANPRLYLTTYPAFKSLDNELFAEVLDDITSNITGAGLLYVENSGYLDKVIQVLERGGLEPEQKVQLGDAIASIRFGGKAQDLERAEVVIDSARPATRLMRAIIENRGVIPAAQYTAIVENFYGPAVTHGYMPDDIRGNIAERAERMKERGVIDEETYQRLTNIHRNFGKTDKNT